MWTTTLIHIGKTRWFTMLSYDDKTLPSKILLQGFFSSPGISAKHTDTWLKTPTSAQDTSLGASFNCILSLWVSNNAPTPSSCYRRESKTEFCLSDASNLSHHPQQAAPQPLQSCNIILPLLETGDSVAQSLSSLEICSWTKLDFSGNKCGKKIVTN